MENFNFWSWENIFIVTKVLIQIQITYNYKISAETQKLPFCPQTLIYSFFESHPVFKGLEGDFLIFLCIINKEISLPPKMISQYFVL